MTLRAENVTVVHEGAVAPALKDVSLEFAEGSFTVLVGPSGCGKSTLLYCLAGLLTPTAGRVVDGGTVVEEPNPRRGMAFQRDILFPWMSVEANLVFALRAKGIPARQRSARVRELLSDVGLSPEVARQRPNQLSGGMRQRVGLARVLAGEPDVMLMDEPFAALDAQTRLRMQDLVVDLWSRLRRTVVFVTHDVDEAIRLSDRIVVLGDGAVRTSIENPLPRPRPADSLADLDGYSDLRRLLHQELQPHNQFESL
ncbi:ABC transporter ATP-binding protein [Mycolicibacterium phlei]|jgi:NitT/TauT family transport system ATP-binding protein|uniref:ABC transporter ATP-binding protein n=1 Tax=Mycolicibacterium phlei TaxID=1771 RepID=UPI00025AF345|nr:ABC transporter ATP-binding protein [Mycolicibacterium phlei]EID09282.1 taurine-transporting AtPase [Mycolicibacterium phlei RIVM601174]MBF4192219.1 taurine-transporting AtPase [Mycolicibacterium phlei]